MLTICVSPTGDTQIVNIQVRAFGIPARRRRAGMPTHSSYSPRLRRAPFNKRGLFSREVIEAVRPGSDPFPQERALTPYPRVAWIYCVDQGRHLPTAAEICRRRGGAGCGGVSRMGSRHASGGLGRTPNPGPAVCAGQRTRASGDRGYRDVLAPSPAIGPTSPSRRKPAVAVAGQRPALPRVPAAARLRRRSARRPSSSAGRHRTGSRRRG